MPSCLVGTQTKVSLELEGADALLAGTHEMECPDPLAKRNVGILEDRAHGDGKLALAVPAAAQTSI